MEACLPCNVPSIYVGLVISAAFAVSTRVPIETVPSSDIRCLVALRFNQLNDGAPQKLNSTTQVRWESTWPAASGFYDAHMALTTPRFQEASLTAMEMS
jgi:hypothetical protein